MKVVNFKRIAITNFLSIGNTPVVIDINPGFHVITGKNIDKIDRRNAIGKSTIADAIYFAIFGDTLRGIKKELISNNITAQGAHIELDFDVITNNIKRSYKIVRTLNPTKVFVYEDGVDVTHDSISNTTKFICQIISATPAIFKNCVIMTINDTIPFMAKSKTEKRKFIEDIFGLEIFSTMITEVRKEYNLIKNEFDNQQIKLTDATNAYNTYITQRDKILLERTSKKDKYDNRINDNKSQRSILIDEIDDLNNNKPSDCSTLKKQIAKYEKALDVCDEKIVDMTGDATSKKISIKQIIDSINTIGTTETICPTCLNKISIEDINHINKEKKRLAVDAKNIKAERDIIIGKIADINSKKKTIRDNICKFNDQINQSSIVDQKINSKRKQLVQIDEWIVELEEDIASVESEDTELDEIIKTTAVNTKKLSSDNKKIRKQLSKLDIVKYIVSEEGVKSYIVGKLLEVLNARMVHYLKILDSNSICIFNEYFEEEIVNEKNKVCSYFNFSGAERKAIDLACLFTFSDLRRMQGEVKYNISIYDELFDSSFDEKGIELVLDVLLDRVDTLEESILLISHRKESIKSVTGDVIYLQKQDGITTRLPYKEL
jgi:DNA repair exonuclease SbcCD ATPase subunit